MTYLDDDIEALVSSKQVPDFDSLVIFNYFQDVFVGNMVHMPVGR